MFSAETAPEGTLLWPALMTLYRGHAWADRNSCPETGIIVGNL
jgi:hypothetical protein